MNKFDKDSKRLDFEAVFWPQRKRRRALNQPPAEDHASKVQKLSLSLDPLLDSQIPLPDSQISLGSPPRVVVPLTPPTDDAPPSSVSPLCRQPPYASPSPQMKNLPKPSEDTDAPAVLHSTAATVVVPLTPPTDDAPPPSVSPLGRQLPYASPSPQMKNVPTPPEDTDAPDVLHSTPATPEHTTRARAITALTEELVSRIHQLGDHLDFADTTRNRVVDPIKRSLRRLHKIVKVMNHSVALMISFRCECVLNRCVDMYAGIYELIKCNPIHGM